jgi:small subunit ribosomal protein S21
MPLLAARPFEPIPQGFGTYSNLIEVWLFMQILVRDNNVDQALRALKKKLQREGVYREMKLRRHYEKPSEKRAREKAAAIRRARKLERKRAERDGAK